MRKYGSFSKQKQRWSKGQLVWRPWVLAKPRFPKYFALHHTRALIINYSPAGASCLKHERQTQKRDPAITQRQTWWHFGMCTISSYLQPTWGTPFSSRGSFSLGRANSRLRSALAQLCCSTLVMLHAFHRLGLTAWWAGRRFWDPWDVSACWQHTKKTFFLLSGHSPPLPVYILFQYAELSAKQQSQGSPCCLTMFPYLAASFTAIFCSLPHKCSKFCSLEHNYSKYLSSGSSMLILHGFSGDSLSS